MLAMCCSSLRSKSIGSHTVTFFYKIDPHSLWNTPILMRQPDEHPEVSGAEMLRFLMEERGLTQTRLSVEAGLALTTISEILSGKRSGAGSG